MSNVKFLDEIERIKNLDGFKNSKLAIYKSRLRSKNVAAKTSYKTGLDMLDTLQILCERIWQIMIKIHLITLSL